MHIHQRIERFLRANPISATRFGRDAVGDPRLVADLRRGREPRARMVNRLEHFMNIYEETTR